MYRPCFWGIVLGVAFCAAGCASTDEDPASDSSPGDAVSPDSGPAGDVIGVFIVDRRLGVGAGDGPAIVFHCSLNNIGHREVLAGDTPIPRADHLGNIVVLTEPAGKITADR